MDTDVKDDRLVEGFSNDALGLTTVLIATGILLILNNFYRRAIEGNHIHPELAVDIQGFRELFVRPNPRNNVHETHRLVAARMHTDRMCPICYGNASFPILTNCGHIFCCECIMGYWRHSASLVSPVNCAICRSSVTVLLPLDWPTDNSDDEDSIRHNNIGLDDYNRRFSGDRPWLEYIWDLPVLVPYVIRNLFDFNGLMIMFRLRVVLIAIAIVGYVLTPFDMIPESVYGFIGFMDDLFVAVLMLVYLSIAVRHFMARRGEAPPQ